MPVSLTLADVVQRVHDGCHHRLRLVHHVLVVGPFRLAFALRLGISPVGMSGVIAEDLADAAAVDDRRRVLDDIEIDIDGFGNRPTDINAHCRRSAVRRDGQNAALTDMLVGA